MAKKAKMQATVYSCFMENISKDVRHAQKEVVEQFLPVNWEFKQVRYTDNHGAALQRCVEENKNPITVLLDIDVIPLSEGAFHFLYDDRWTCSNGALVGCVQRANHIQNNKHLYVGPFCMAFMNDTYRELGSPTFMETYRGDVGEELTYCWQKNHKSIYMLWPSDCQQPQWELFENVKFGIGTTYEGLFYHQFCSRTLEMQDAFVSRCKKFLKTHVFEGATK